MFERFLQASDFLFPGRQCPWGQAHNTTSEVIRVDSRQRVYRCTTELYLGNQTLPDLFRIRGSHGSFLVPPEAFTS